MIFFRKPRYTILFLTDETLCFVACMHAMVKVSANSSLSLLLSDLSEDDKLVWQVDFDKLLMKTQFKECPG